MSLLNVSSLLVLMTIFGFSVSFPDGAPISTCQTMAPVHQGVFPQPNPAPYIFKVSSSSYQNGKPMQVQILGPGYRGLLLETRTFQGTNLLGSWLQPPNNTKILPCPENPTGAVTHSNTNLKTQSTTYTWMPPDSNCPQVIFFTATVAQSYEIYWLRVQSAVIWKDPEATCGTVRSTWSYLVLAILSFQLSALLKLL
ncbi:putative defense protein 3 [Discoglossus pictus]